MVTTVRTGAGSTKREMIRRMIWKNILSSYVRVSSLVECSGTVTSVFASSKSKAASSLQISSRQPG